MKISTSLRYGMQITGADAGTVARMMVQAGFQGVDFQLNDQQMEPARIQEAAWHDRYIAMADALERGPMPNTRTSCCRATCGPWR